LGDHPLLAYSIAAAQQSDLFAAIVVCSDAPATLAIAEHYGARSFLRSGAWATDDAPDLVWITEWLDVQHAGGQWSDLLAILRPTNPFRQASTIQRAVDGFRHRDAHSLRAVQPVREHPGKMWMLDEEQWLTPVIPQVHPDGTPWHSSPTQTLPPYYVQNASLELVWTYIVETTQSISGTRILGFLTEGFEGLDINDEADWTRAEALVASGAAVLPRVDVAPVP